MSEMPHAGIHHGDAVFIRCGDDFCITHTAAGLNNRFRARLGHYIDAIAERDW